MPEREIRADMPLGELVGLLELELQNEGYVFFNNFPVRLPGGHQRSPITEPFLDSFIYEKGRRKGMTPRDFFGEIDRVIAEQGIDVAEILRLQHKTLSYLTGPGGQLREEDRSKYIQTRTDLARLTLPVFARLIQEGYSMEELVS